jgi:hypothetical protein
VSTQCFPGGPGSKLALALAAGITLLAGAQSTILESLASWYVWIDSGETTRGIPGRYVTKHVTPERSANHPAVDTKSKPIRLFTTGSNSAGGMEQEM